ncbi:Zinc carboxypeptidase [Belliella baltica DSM 15883]|uniref:Zinc carboxypeptidase n=1 Tax=Belliella baltica (strain DSM 15883 / CIP 108006 / LMG 21964 / BA134) TaxID=866536 RepID=I3Z1V8_BELBD|nr:M14 metallopeptidase family protein [Belliella baltica]AFL83226.1 Zinc carboxypeptidase [Belliella baltica DSM 15883]
MIKQTPTTSRIGIFLLGLLILSAQAVFGQQIPTPEEHFGFGMGKDYHVSNYSQTEAYFKKVAEISDRAKLVSIGKTEEGRDQWMMIVTSPENHKNLDRFKEISVKMARAEKLTEAEARALADEGRAVVWIDGGLHSTETVGTHQLTETIYNVLSRNDKENQRILENVIILFVHANPDGHEKIGNWYMRNPEPEKRSLSGLPVLYQKYIGHDNNRDFYIQNMKESVNMGHQLFVEWIPQVMYNHHQRGPAGSVLAGPPYRDPFNYVFDPMMVTGIDAVGAAMYNRLNAENKPGFTRMNGSSFSTWYNGGLRTTTHYHNIIGILTEIVGGPNPESIPLVPDRLVPNANTPFPVTPQATWKYQQSIDYSVSLNYAVLDYAARNRDHLLYNMYSMAKGSVQRGSQDYWTPFPKKVEAIKTAYADSRSNGQGSSRWGIPSVFYDSIYQAPEKRDPRGFIIPSDQKDFPTAVKFINALIKTGIRIEKANSQFQVQGKTYPKGSYIVKTDQAFRPHIIDMFEPQDYPNDFQYPGGPPIRPYDAAGWTLAFQMGVEFDRILDGFDGPFETLTYGILETPIESNLADSRNGYLISSVHNDAFAIANEFLKKGVKISRTTKTVDGLPAGSFYIPSDGYKVLEAYGKKFGVEIKSAKSQPSDLMPIKPSRIALYDYYGGSMPSGWVRWILEQYNFEFELIFAKEIDQGNLNKKYDAILFISGGIPNVGSRGGSRGPSEEEIPAEYRHMVGGISADKSIPQLKSFIENGGKVVAVGSASVLAYHLELPVRNALVEIQRDGSENPLPGEKYYVPGSVLETRINTEVNQNWGMDDHSFVLFNNNPVFKLKPEAKLQGIQALSWFDTQTPLRSGWAWGEAYLEDGITGFVAPIGKGQLVVYTPEITYRAQSHGTFKMLFNNLYQ